MAGKKRRVRSTVSGLNKGLVADTLGVPVDLAALGLNALIAGGGYAGHKLGLLDTPPDLIERPVGGSDWIAAQMAGAGFTNPDEEADLTEDAVRFGAGLLGPAAILKTPQAAARVVENAAAPRTLGSQRGAIVVVPKGKRGRDLKGLPGRVTVDGQEQVYGGFRPAQEAAERYMRDAGLSYERPDAYVPVDPDRAQRLAVAYDQMPHAPQDPAVRAAYQALADETMGQYEAARRAGARFEFMPGSGDPYGNPRNALRDLYENDRLRVFPTDAGFGSSQLDVADNPLLALTGEKWNGQPVRVNDAFRAVHDYFGHAKEGVGFRAAGEENAWQQHASMFSPAARRAMTSETRGQNSWVNFGPHAQANRGASPAGTVYADQKTGLLPEWASTEGYGGLALPRYLLED